ncbi:MAG: Fe-S protein assembly co-chaperone HscB [Pseudomonadota bacterium]
MSNRENSENYFQLLGLAESSSSSGLNFNIDKNLLTNNFRELQRQFHPDKFAHSSDIEKRISVQNSALINDAFQTLKNPLKRAIYQLSLLGVELKDNETTMDAAFLMQQMELREKLDTIKQLPEPADDLEKMQSMVAQELKTNTQQISQLFSSVEQQSLEEIKNTILKMQFLTKLQQQCDDLEEDLSNQL